MVFDHPKFGLIPCVSTIADISKGEEVRQIFEAIFILKYEILNFLQITVGYGYELEHAPDWYIEAWENSKKKVSKLLPF